MFKHFIILSSSYSSGTRIAMHYVIGAEMNSQMLADEVKTIKQYCGETVSISTHYVETGTCDWASVAEKDAFFADVYVVESLVEFVNLISEDRVLKGIDIAKYILSVMKCTHLQLEKLVYMCYADYLCLTGKRLFDDRIYAFRYGPVIESVYEEYKGYKEIVNDISINAGSDVESKKMPARSRILFAEDGVLKIAQIDSTIAKYGKCTAAELVEITHISGGPWDSVDKDGLYVEIPDDIIRERHFKESIA